MDREGGRLRYIEIHRYIETDRERETDKERVLQFVYSFFYSGLFVLGQD